MLPSESRLIWVISGDDDDDGVAGWVPVGAWTVDATSFNVSDVSDWKIPGTLRLPAL